MIFTPFLLCILMNSAALNDFPPFRPRVPGVCDVGMA